MNWITKTNLIKHMTENNENPLGQNIRMLRHKRRLNQAAVAEVLGLSIPAYSKIETGITDINISRLNQIAEFYSVTVTSLLYGGQEPQQKNLEEENSALKAALSQNREELSRLQAKCINLLDELMSKNED